MELSPDPPSTLLVGCLPVKELLDLWLNWKHRSVSEVSIMDTSMILVPRPYGAGVLNLRLTLLADHTRNRPITAHSRVWVPNNRSISEGAFARSMQGISSWVNSLSFCL